MKGVKWVQPGFNPGSTHFCGVHVKGGMETNLRELKKAMSNWGMKIHWGKTEVMVLVGKEKNAKCMWMRKR